MRRGAECAAKWCCRVGKPVIGETYHLLALMLLATGAAAAPRGQHIALTLSGGVSLGAYEAGLTWTTVRLLRSDNAVLPRGELVALTGASCERKCMAGRSPRRRIPSPESR